MSQDIPVRTKPLRIGDAERDRAVTMLSDHFVAGRLAQEEFEERNSQATRARFADDLRPLFADLPDSSADQQPTALRTWQPVSRPGPPPFIWLRPVLLVGLVIMAVALDATWILGILLWVVLFGVLHNHRHRHWRHHTHHR